MTDGAEISFPAAELSVVVLHARDAARATQAGADHLLLATRREHDFGAASLPELSAVLRETDVPVWVLLDPATPESALTAQELGAHGVVMGFLDSDLSVDRVACAEIIAHTGSPWLFHGLDAALDSRRAWNDVQDLPGLAGVLTAGSTRGLAHGAETLIARAGADPATAAAVVAAGGLTADLVPWLVRAGVHRFAVGTSAREDDSWRRGLVSTARVRTWRMLLDDAAARAAGLEPGPVAGGVRGRRPPHEPW